MSIFKVYNKQCSRVGSFQYANNFTLYVELTNRDGNSNTNQSYVDYNIYCQSSGSGSISANHSIFFQINGNTIVNETIKINVNGPNAYIQIANGTIPIAHQSDGSKTIGFSASIQGISYGISASLSENFELERIGRYANISNFIVYKRDETSVSVNYSVDSNIDWAWYSIDNGNSWYNLPNSKIISGLSENTSYQFKIRVRRTDSQLTSDSNTYTFSTYAYPKVSYAPSFTIGNSISLTLYNPLGRTLKIYLIGENNSEMFCGSTTKDSIFIPASSEWTEFWYSTIPGSNQGRYSVRILCEELGRDTIIIAGTYSIAGNEGPIFNDFEFYDSNSETSRLTGDNQKIILGYSDITAYISSSNLAKAQNSASMRYYRMAIGNKSQNVYVDDSVKELYIPIEKVNNEKIDLYAVDNRGNSTIVTKSATAIKYEKISISSVIAKRVTGIGTTVTLDFTINLWNQSFGNTTNSIKTIGYEYKLASEPDSSFVSGSTLLTYETLGNKVTGSVNIKGDLGADGFNASNSYTIKLTVSDELSNDKFVVVLGNGNPGIAIFKDKIAIGRKYDKSIGGAFQVGGDSYLDGDIFIENNKSVKTLFPIILYDNSSGTSGAVSLSDNSNKYKYIEIFFKDNTDAQNSIKIIPDISIYFNLNIIAIDSNSKMYCKNRQCALFGDVIYQRGSNTTSEAEINSSGNSLYAYEEAIKITKVIGWIYK